MSTAPPPALPPLKVSGDDGNDSSNNDSNNNNGNNDDGHNNGNNNEDGAATPSSRSLQAIAVETTHGDIALDGDLPPVKSDIWDSEGRDQRYYFSDGTLTTRGKLRKLIDSPPVTTVMVIATLWALFAIDLMLLLLPVEADDTVLGIMFFFFVIFVIELPLELYVQGKAYFEFFFWLDLFTTISLLPEVLLLFSDVEENSVLDILTLARAGRAARASSRAARVVRFVKHLSKKKTIGADDFEIDHEIEEEDDDIIQSEVGVKFTEATTRRVVGIILLVLIMLALLDLISPGDWISAEEGSKAALEQLVLSHSAVAVGESDPAGWRQTYLEPFLKALPETRILKINGVEVYYEDISHLRAREIATYDEASDGYVAEFDIKGTTKLLAGVNLILVCCIIVILAVGNLFFITKADSLVISPVERMAGICRRLVKNPLAQLKSDIYASGETGVVLQMLAKLVGLIQTGFGEAGSRIIAKNLSEEGGLNIMVPGAKVRGCYGFCDIRNFTDITEKIGPDCMFLVNSIADIVHGNAHRRYGSANKNIGDAFLLVWKLWSKAEWRGLGRKIKKLPSEDLVAASAVNSFLHTIKDMYDSPVLQEIGRRAPAYAPIRMGYGLHSGYAIEGAVGSLYKIDASYLSPHLNLASRLEGLTKAYGVPILMSGEFVDLLPQSWKDRVRLVDIITVKGSETPLEIFVIDDITPIEDEHIMDPPTNDNPPPQVVHRQIHLDAISAFRKGNWDRTKELLKDFIEKTGGDRPSEVILDWMEEVGGKPPANFSGYRRITSKSG